MAMRSGTRARFNPRIDRRESADDRGPGQVETMKNGSGFESIALPTHAHAREAALTGDDLIKFFIGTQRAWRRRWERQKIKRVVKMRIACSFLTGAAFPFLFALLLQPLQPLYLVSIDIADRFPAHAVPADDLTFVFLAAFATYGLVADAAFPHGVFSRV
jgi:sterol desaturase/sphingolipid hydroxylase (fatty acid hydroxylase superfamily)